MSGQRLTLAEQEKIVAEIVRLARELEQKGDPFLLGQCMHLRERAESLACVIETPGTATAS